MNPDAVKYNKLTETGRRGFSDVQFRDCQREISTISDKKKSELILIQLEKFLGHENIKLFSSLTCGEEVPVDSSYEIPLAYHMWLHF